MNFRRLYEWRGFVTVREDPVDVCMIRRTATAS